MDQSVKIIGVVHSTLKSVEDCPLQESENAPGAEIEIFPEFIEGIKDLDVGGEILLLTWLHKADRTVIKCVSRRNYNSPPLGVFSTRSPDRPNPIGIHHAKILSKSADGRLKISRLEVIDQTPLIDIKPVLK
jgi:tRNA-Thr(GGU) m(6)t(6)A37 methyltransferase TsaA